MKCISTLLFSFLFVAFSINAQTAQITGKVDNPLGGAMANVTIELIASDGTKQSTSTNDAGIYTFSAPIGDTYSLQFIGEEEPLEGVSTLDLVFGLQHIIHVREFTFPHEYLSADVNGSGTVSVADMWQMRQMILGMQTSWTKPSWVFIPKGFELEIGDEIPASIPYQIELLADETEVNFTGVKTGDISGNAY